MKKNVFLNSNCPMHRSMAILGSKWNPILIWALQDRKARFGQIAASVGLISRKVLTTTLKKLEIGGLVKREEFRELPPRVEYSLTEKGLALIPIMLDLVNWDIKYFSAENMVDNALPICTPESISHYNDIEIH